MVVEVVFSSSVSDGLQLRVLLPNQRTCFVGRGSAGLRLADKFCSRRHAAVYRDRHGGIRIRDLKGRNGTFVNGKRVKDTALLDGDLVRVGRTCFRVSLRWVEPEKTRSLRVSRRQDGLRPIAELARVYTTM